MRFIKWHDGKKWTQYGDLAAFSKGTGHGKHSIMVDYAVFERASPPAHGKTFKADAFDLRLKDGAGPIDKGVLLPGINDAFTGDAPDLGAHERGQPLPHYGPRAKTWPAPARE